VVKEEGTSFEVQIEIHDECKQVHFALFSDRHLIS